MRFSLRALFGYWTGAALVAFAASISGHYAFLILALVVALSVAVAARHHVVRCVTLTALGCGASLWGALFVYTFSPDWLRVSGEQPSPMADPAFAKFLQETFWMQSVFVSLMGVGSGAALAALVWLYGQTRDYQRSESQETSAFEPAARAADVLVDVNEEHSLLRGVDIAEPSAERARTESSQSAKEPNETCGNHTPPGI